jgi:putative nucleotidyltransferase with HDIG domain
MTTTLIQPTQTGARSRVRDILNDVERLRPLPISVTRVVQALDDPDVSAQQIAHLIGLDQALAADVLRLSNAASFAASSPTASVLEAVVRLGFVRVKSLVLAAGATTLLTQRLSGYRLTGRELWDHAVETASLARYVAEAIRYPDLEEAYVAGLLHDIGKLILDQYVKWGYALLADLVRSRGLLFWQAEELVFGMDHGAAGGLIAAKWQFPLALTDAIRCHHWPTLSRARPELAAIVNVADALPPRAPTSLAVTGVPHVHPEALRLLKLDEAGLKRLQSQMPWQPGV